jgi:hypothetical protein
MMCSRPYAMRASRELKALEVIAQRTIHSFIPIFMESGNLLSHAILHYLDNGQ